MNYIAKVKLEMCSIQAADIYQYLFFETEIDECASGPCTNGATCNNQINSYTCTCSAGYTGTRCETGNVVLLM